MAADSIIEAVIEIGAEILETISLSSNKNSKKSTKPGCLFWFFVLIIGLIIWMIW